MGGKSILETKFRIEFGHVPLFGPYRSHFLSKKSLIAAKNETKEERRKIGERDTTSACE
jgi:hypothetical protein